MLKALIISSIINSIFRFSFIALGHNYMDWIKRDQYWLEYSRELIRNFDIFFMNLVYIYQIFEWIILIHIIISQKNLHLEEIIPMIKSKGYNNKEKCMKISFIFIITLYIIYFFTRIIIEIVCTNLWDVSNTFNVLITDVCSIICCIFALSFFTLIYLLKNNAHYEYKRITKPLMIYFIVAIIAYLCVIIEFVVIRPGVFINRKLEPALRPG